uniref:ATP-dependent DNA helicase n=1 Tax=Daphnia galeata TaxID=27404 RepID=A0A8J2RPW4_9CRUS|nr:unnamed protein product [Daphnia galeata]
MLSMGVSMACVALTGIAASNLPRGRKIHSFFNFPVNMKVSALNRLKNQTDVKTLGVFVIDEISYISPELLGQIAKRLQQIMGMRCSGDVLHSAVLQRMRNPRADESRVDPDYLESIKTITPFDFRNDIEWYTAPIVVTTREFLYKRNPQFIGSFVADAPGYLTENVNSSIGLCNGTPIQYHSMTLDTREDFHRILSFIQNGVPNIELEYPPSFIHVKIPNADPTEFLNMTLIPGEVIIPVKLQQAETYSVQFLD